MGMQLLEDTYPVIEPCAVEGSVLIDRLLHVENLRLRKNVIFDARTEAAMNDAIRILLAAGYAPDDVSMVEGDFYSVRFAPTWSLYPAIDRWPHWVKLRFLTDSVHHLPLALARRSEDRYVWYLGSYHVTFGTSSSDAEKMRYHFERDHPRVSPIWVPIFDRTPLLLKRDGS